MPNKKEEYLSKLLKVQNEHQRSMHNIVINALKEEDALVAKLQQEESDDIKRTFGEKVSDKIASFGGSWTFIFIFFILLFSWMTYSEYQGTKAFDPYPYILLNLILSCLAAIQAPIILMSGNRKETRDRRRAHDDYLINLKAELENRMTNQKLDLLISKQFKELIDIQEMQIQKIDHLEALIKKLHPTVQTKKKAD